MDKIYNIALVDDHRLILDGIKNMLSESKIFNVLGEFTNPTLALQDILENPLKYDIVITDISMPEMNGSELCNAVKTEHKNIKVLILSVHDQVEFVKKAIAADADGYMLKIISRDEFIDGLNNLIENGVYFSGEILPILCSEAKKSVTQPIESKLTPREIEVLRLMAHELTSKEIAEKLKISKQTVDSHRNNMMEKTSSKSIVGLLKFGIRNKIISFD